MTRITLSLVSILALLALAPAARAQEDGAVMYVTQYRIQQSRLDSLVTLIRTYDVPWHAEIAARVPGYQRFFYRHDTGGEYNLVIATLFPNWDMVRGDEIDFDGIWEGYRSRNSITPAQEEEVNAMFEWAYEGSSHIDNIYRPITAGD
jgi:hypothetical protein